MEPVEEAPMTPVPRNLSVACTWRTGKGCGWVCVGCGVIDRKLTRFCRRSVLCNPGVGCCSGRHAQVRVSRVVWVWVWMWVLLRGTTGVFVSVSVSFSFSLCCVRVSVQWAEAARALTVVPRCAAVRPSSRPFRVLSVENGSPEYDAEILNSLRTKLPSLHCTILNYSKAYTRLVAKHPELESCVELVEASYDDFEPDEPYDLVHCAMWRGQFPTDANMEARLLSYCKPGGSLVVFVQVRVSLLCQGVVLLWLTSCRCCG